MKNMRKRILSLMVVLMMSLSLVQPTAFATVGEGTDPGEEGTTPPTEETDPGEEGTTPPTVEVNPGDEGATPPAEAENNKPGTDSPWDVFYDEENDIYKLTFNIGEKADGNQVLDLTNALDLLNKYSNDLKENAGPSKTVYDDDVLSDLFNTTQTVNDYPKEQYFKVQR